MKQLKTPGIRFIVTSICNYDCDYCHNEWEPKSKPVSGLEESLVRELIVSAKSLGAREVDITGGEPLLRMDRVETILRTAREEELWTNVTTNGYFLEEYADRLRELGLKEIHVHIPSLNPQQYRAMMKGNADLGKVLPAVEKIADEKYFSLIKANIPIEYGVNDDEIPVLVQYFNKLGIIPRFIETMSTKGYGAVPQRSFDELMKERLGDLKLKGSYLWGINEYESEGRSLETLRCICFDRKCDICPETNFIHVDQNYKVRPCNLRPFRVQAVSGNATEALTAGLEFLSKQTDVPTEYRQLWGQAYVPLGIK